MKILNMAMLNYSCKQILINTVVYFRHTDFFWGKIMLYDEILSRAHNLKYHAHDILSRAHNLQSLAHDILSHAQDTISI